MALATFRDHHAEQGLRAVLAVALGLARAQEDVLDRRGLLGPVNRALFRADDVVAGRRQDGTGNDLGNGLGGHGGGLRDHYEREKDRGSPAEHLGGQDM
jgi:hypothetical protein